MTALLNLDTSAAFLTPVLIYTARSRGEGEAPLLYGCLLLSNAGSLFLPGSNLTNLIVLGHLHLSGGQFLAHMWAPALVALVVTAAVIACFEHRSLRVRTDDTTSAGRPVLGLGLLGVLAATMLVVFLHNPAIPVAAVGIAVVGVRVATRKENVPHAADVLGVPVLVGLFGVAVALGTLGRVWSGPADLLAHLDRWGTAAVAVSSVLVNNLPAASLLAARRPEHPFSLLIGLNLGPSLFVSGSRLVPVAAGGQVGRSAAVGCQSIPTWARGGAAIYGLRPRGSHAVGVGVVAEWVIARSHGLSGSRRTGTWSPHLFNLLDQLGQPLTSPMSAHSGASVVGTVRGPCVLGQWCKNRFALVGCKS